MSQTSLINGPTKKQKEKARQAIQRPKRKPMVGTDGPTPRPARKPIITTAKYPWQKEENKTSKSLRALGVALVIIGCVLVLCMLIVTFYLAKVTGGFALGLVAHGCWVAPLSVIFVIIGIMCIMMAWE